MASSIRIDEDSMALELSGSVITAAVRVGDLWRVIGWPRLLNRNEALTALTLAERLLAGS